MIKPYYEEPGITIYHGDCLDILPHLDPVDLVLTDPPYGIGRDKGFEGFEGFGGLENLSLEQDLKMTTGIKKDQTKKFLIQFCRSQNPQSFLVETFLQIYYHRVSIGLYGIS